MTANTNAWGERLLAERAKRLAERPVHEATVERRRVCVVETAGHLYGLGVEDIGRVMPYSAPAPLAGAAPSLLGIIGRNAGFVLVYDLAALVTNANAERAGEGHLILLRQHRPLTALRVRRTLAVQDIEVLSAEETLNLPTHTPVAAYGRHDDNRIVSIIDIGALMKTSARTHSGG